MRPSISTGVHSTMTVAMEKRMLLPHAANLSWRLNMNMAPMKQPNPYKESYGVMVAKEVLVVTEHEQQI